MNLSYGLSRVSYMHITEGKTAFKGIGFLTLTYAAGLAKQEATGASWRCTSCNVLTLCSVMCCPWHCFGKQLCKSQNCAPVQMLRDQFGLTGLSGFYEHACSAVCHPAAGFGGQ